MNTIYLHPMIVHFPIALLTIGAIAAIISKFFRGNCPGPMLFQYAGISIITGAIATAVAILSGFLFTQEMGGIMGEIRSTHILLAFISVVCGSITAILMGMAMWSKSDKVAMLQNLALIGSLLTAAMIGITGHYGGVMAFA